MHESESVEQLKNELQEIRKQFEEFKSGVQAQRLEQQEAQITQLQSLLNQRLD